MIYVTGDLHGGESSYHVSSAQFKPAKRGDIVICCGDFGGVWFHDYHSNNKNSRSENAYLEMTLRQRVLWLTVDGNHENFARLFGGEFPIVEIFGGKAYKIRENVYYLKRGEVFTIEGHTFFAFGGANSHDRFGGKVPSLAWGRGYDRIPARTEGKDWWPEEIPSEDDFDNACQNLDRVGWMVDYVITHTCPESQRHHFLANSRIPDPTETMLQKLYEKLNFKSWHFGHFHLNKQIDKFNCHYNEVVSLER
ncbi:MAG: metallophosphoesterase [Desulfuromonadales bacterium]|nr:metallophosphoesterase [Desulfuromonadales bacterium]